MSTKLTLEQFINRSSQVHGDKYDYSKSVYKDHYGKVEIICPVHGSFLQGAGSHMAGCGCKKCAQKAYGDTRRLSKEEYIARANKAHDNFYNYDKFEYKSSSEKSTVTCPIHGDFEVTPSNHLRRKCPKCAKKKRAEDSRSNTEEFISKAEQVHGDTYDYSEVEYTKAIVPVTIICNKHGKFSQTPHVHLLGCGCQKCGAGNVSRKETEVQEYISSICDEKVLFNNRKIIPPYELDIYIPHLKKAVEFNGEWWHYDIKNPKYRGDDYHNMKTKMCRNRDIELLHIRERDWDSDQEQTKQTINNFITT